MVGKIRRIRRCPKGPQDQEVRAECNRHKPLLGSTGRVLWGSQADQKEQDCGKVRGPARQERMFLTRAFRRVVSGTYMTPDSADYYVVHEPQNRLVSVQGPRRPLSHTKWM